MKKGEKHNILSIILTLLVVAIYLIPNLASAVKIGVETDKPVYTSNDSSVEFELAVDVEENERIPIQRLILKIESEAGNIECTFSASGGKMSGCPNIDIINASAKSYTQGPGYGYGYGYGYGGNEWSTVPIDFGYGYGYGYGYGDMNIYPKELRYTVRWNFSAADAAEGSYKASLEAYADDSQGTSVRYASKSPAEFSIELETDVEAAYDDLTAGKIKKDNADLDNVVSDLNLITAGLKDTKIKWSSSNSSVINPISGKVSRPPYGQEDKIVDLTANISKNSESMLKSFTAIVLKESISDIQAAYDDLTAGKIKKDNADLDNVVSDLNLVTVGLKDTKIKWSSSNSSVINPFSGKVSRLSYDKEDKIVDLTANISKNSESMSKTFTATVLKESLTDAEAVSIALTSITVRNMLLNNNNADNITTNLNLTASAQNGVKLAWSSGNSAIIETTGSVSMASSDTQVAVSVKASKGITSGSKSFTFTVKGTSDPDLIALSNAKLALTEELVLNGNPDKDNIIGNLNFPAALSGHDVAVSWASGSSAVAANGTITRSATEDITAPITATFSKNSKTMSKKFELTVKKKVAPAEVSGNKVTVNEGEAEIVLDTTNIASVAKIDVPSTIAEDQVVSLNLDSLRNDEGKLNLSTNNLTMSRNSSGGISYSVVIPEGSIVSGSDKWNGMISLPTIKAVAEVTPVASAGNEISSVNVVIEVGFTQGQLNFTKAAKLTIPGMAEKKAGYTDSGDVFHAIPACTAAQIADPDTLDEGKDCYTGLGADMLIWTRHFTKFAAYTETSSDGGGGGNNGGGSSSSGSSGGGGPVIKFSAPATAPAPEPIKQEEKPAAEEKKEEAQKPEVQPAKAPEAQPEAQKSGLGAITGAVAGKLFGTKNRSMWLDLLMVFIVVGGFISFHLKVNYGGLPTANPLARAAYLHKIAQKAHRKGRHAKAEKLYKRAQELRERGERGMR